MISNCPRTRATPVELKVGLQCPRTLGKRNRVQTPANVFCKTVLLLQSSCSIHAEAWKSNGKNHASIFNKIADYGILNYMIFCRLSIICNISEACVPIILIIINWNRCLHLVFSNHGTVPTLIIVIR